VLLSLQNMLIGISFIYGSTTHEYASYSLIYSALLLLASVQNVVVLVPLTTKGSAAREEDRHGVLDSMVGAQSVLLWASGLGLAAFSLTVSIEPLLHRVALCLGCIAGVVGSWVREYRRSEQILLGHHVQLVWADVLSTGVLLAGLLATISGFGTLGAAVALFITGLAGIAGSLAARPIALWPKTLRIGMLTARDLLSESRWTLPWTLLVWLQNSSFPFLVMALAGKTAVAEVAAARLAVAPIGLLAGGYNRALLPQTAGAVARGEVKSVLPMAERGMGVLTGTVATYSLAVLLLVGIGLARALPPAYANSLWIVPVWVAVALGSALRGVSSTALLSLGRAQDLLGLAIVGSAVSVTAAVILSQRFGAGGVIGGVAIGEILLSLLAWRTLALRCRSGDVRNGGRQY
jgi:O-antigen/teichoic acid export membrane protein